MSEYIKKEDTIKYLNDLFGEMYHVSLGNVLQSLDSLQTYSFPDSAENKGDLISRQAVLDGIAEWIVNGYADSEADCSHISSLVTHLPSVENKGEWLDDGFCGDCKCSVCKHEFDCDIANMRGFDFALPKFCPNCGARMKGGEI